MVTYVDHTAAVSPGQSGVIAGTNSFQVTLPTHAAGDRMLLWVSGKPSTTATPTIDQGWTLVGSGTAGTGTFGVDTGDMFWALYAKDATSGAETAPTLSYVIAANGLAEWTTMVYRPGTGSVWADSITTSAPWVVAASDTTVASSPLTGTPSAFPNAPTAGDAIAAFGATPTDSTTLSSLTVTATGLSSGTLTGNRAASTIGNDMSLYWGDWINFTGTASSAVTITFTMGAGTNTAGPVVAAHLRQGSPSSGASLAATNTVTAAGEVGKAIGAALAATVAITAAGVVGTSSGATISETATITAVGNVTAAGEGTASVDATDTITAAGSVGNSTGASLAATDTITAAGATGVASGASVAATGTITAAGSVSAVGASGASVTATVTITAAGVVAEFAGPRTQTDNRAGGRVRSGLGVVTFDPPLVDLPATMVRGQSYPIAQAFGPVTMVGNQPHFTVDTQRGVQTRYQILYGNRDITYLFDIPTPPIEFQRAQPFDEGPGTLRLPQFANPGETAGEGRWSWLKTGKPVRYRIIRVSDDAILKTFRFISTGFDTDGGNLSVQLGGRATGRMGLRDQQPPVFSSTQKPKKLIARVFESIGLPFDRSGDGPDFEMGRFGDTGMLDYAQQILARCWNSAGRQWTVMPNADGEYEMALRDNTTVHFTVYLDDAQISSSLHRDISEEPKAIFGRGTTPDGKRILNGVYPGLVQIDRVPDYPMSDGDPFGIGTTEDDTEIGHGAIAALFARLQTLGLLTRGEAAKANGVYTQDVADAVQAAQDEAGLAIAPEFLGIMTTDTWDVLFNAGKVGYSVWWSKIEPMAWDRRLRRWKRTPDGVILGKNPTYDPKLLRVDRTIDFEAGLERGQMVRNAKRELAAANDPNWTGTVTLGMGAVIRGDWSWGDPLTEADVMADWEIDPAMNGKVVSSAGGELLVGVGGITYGSGATQLTVDTRQRDALPIWEVVRRNKESRADLNRRADHQRRSSSERKDVLYPTEEYGGRIDPVRCEANTWRVFQVVMGQAGQVSRVRMHTEEDEAKFVIAVCGEEISPAFLAANVPNPLLDKSGWYDEDFRDRLRDDFKMCYIVGEPGSAAGYSPHVESDGEGLTGKWDDESPWSFETGEQPILHVAVYANNDCYVVGGDNGRIFWNQEIVGS